MKKLVFAPKLYFAAVMIFMLSSCSPPVSRIFAMMENGNLIFHVRDGGIFTKAFGWDDRDFLAYKIRVFSAEKHYWIADPIENPVLQNCKDKQTLPLKYAEVRCVWEGEKAKPLDANKIYTVNLEGEDWSNTGHGVFQLSRDGDIINLTNVWFEEPAIQSAE